MQRRHCDLVLRREAEKVQFIDLPRTTTLPESIQPRRSEALRLRVPNGEVQLQRDGDLGIEMIAAPRPAGPANQRGQMIRRMRVAGDDRLVAQGPRDRVGL